MTKEGQLLAALSHLESAYKSAIKSSYLIEDKTMSQILREIGDELHILYTRLQDDAFGGRKPVSTVPP